MENLASAGFTTRQIMQAMPGMLDLAASSGEDLASSADIAASTLNGFGLAADQAGHVADVLAKNAGATNAAVKDTGEAMKYIAPVAQEAGWSLESVTAAVGELANTGIKGSQAGTTLRSMFNSLVRPSDAAATAMEQMGFKAYDSNHKMKSLSLLLADLDKATAKMTTQQKENTIATLFGQEAMSGVLTLIKNGSGNLDTLTESYKNADGAASEMAKTMQDNAKSSIEQMMGSLETAAIVVEETFAPKITELANYIQDLANKFADLTPQQQEFYLKLAAGAMALGPAVKGVGLLTTGVGGMMKVIGKIAPLFTTAVAAEGAIGAEAAASSVALGGLGIAGGVTLGAIVALGAGIAGVITYNELLSKSVDTSTDDLNIWEQAINSMTGSTIKSKAELQNMGLVYKDFGDGIGDKFKKKVDESTKAIGEFSMFLSNIDFDGVITSDESAQFTKRINDLCTNAVNTIKERQTEVQQAMSKMFVSDDTVLDENEKTTLASLNNQSEAQIKQVTSDQNEINKIYTDAIKKRGHLTDEEKKLIKDRYIEIAQIELAASQEAKTQQEKSYLKHDFTNRANNLSAADGSKLLKDQRAKLDEQQIKDKTNYDVQLDQLNELIKTQSGKEAAATQATIDKFTEKKNKIAELEQQQWEESIATIERENPSLVGVYNKYNGDILSEADKKKEATLQTYKDTFSNMNDITETGMYSLYNVTTGKFNDVYVTVDKTTKQVTGAWSTTMVGAGGYTKQMAEDAQKAALDINLSFSKVTQGLDVATSVYQDAAGNMVSNTGQVIGKLGELQYASDGTMYKIMDLNGNPIKVPVNKDGTITDLDAIKKAIANIPTTKTVYIKTQQDIFDENRTHLNADGSVANKYTGTNGGEEGVSFVNESGHGGWEISSGSEDIAYLGSGSKITNHMTSVSQMNKEISNQVGNSIGKIVNTLVSALSQQSNKLSLVASNTAQLVVDGKESTQLNEKLAINLIDKMSSSKGTFSNLNTEITNANAAKEKASNMKTEENYWVSYYNQWIDSVETDIDSVKDKIDETTDENYKKQLQAQQKALEKQKDSLKKEYDNSKDAAEKEIKLAKETADQQVKIAEEKKNKLIKLAEAATTAIKSRLEEEKTAAEKVIKDKMTLDEKAYNAKVSNIEKETKATTKSIDDKIAALEEETQATTRAEERKVAKDNINMLKTKMANTASQADKDALALLIKNAQKELNKKEDTWDIEDEKAKLEERKTTLAEQSEIKKEALKTEYEEQKTNEEEKLKATDAYYNKLLENDSINAQARYTILNSSSEELVTLLNSYAPGWQDAGQSLADSLLTGLNSNKQSVQDAVSEMIGIRGTSGTNTSSSNVAYYDEKGNLLKGYATGTLYNHTSGLYKVDENGFETTSSGSVAYVSKGAAINNNMQSIAAIKDITTEEVSRQVALMKASLMQMQSEAQSKFMSNIYNATHNNTNNYSDGGLHLNIENLNLETGQDVEQFSDEMNTLRLKKKKY